MIKRFFTFLLIAAIALSAMSCTAIDSAFSGVTNAFGVTDTATVIAKTAQIRTSYAVVAADLLEVKRNDRLEVMDMIEFEKVLWYRVRAQDDAQTEGWIEAQNVITSETLSRSQKLAEEFANLACFLASDAGAYITGTAINVDGGRSPVV